MYNKILCDDTNTAEKITTIFLQQARKFETLPSNPPTDLFRILSIWATFSDGQTNL